VKCFWIIALLALLNARLVGAAELAATNQMPSTVHDLMEQSGLANAQSNTDIAASDANSLRNLPPIKKKRLRPLERPVPKSGWSFWKSFGVKYVHHNHDPMSALAPAPLTPYSALAQFEYDVTYSFDF